MRETELWRRLESHLGPGYAQVWAQQQVMAELDGRTVVEAIAAGLKPKAIWRACWTALELPPHDR